MNQIDQHTLEILEWPAIQARLAAEAGSPIGRELTQATQPLPTLEEAKKVQKEVEEFRALLSRETALPFDQLCDIRESIRQSRPEGAILAAIDFVRVAGSLEAAAAIRHAIARSRNLCPQLHAIASQFADHTDLVDAIHASVEATGEVKDTASRKLNQLRLRIHELRNLIHSRLQSLLTDPPLQPYIAELLVTLRNERYVIPVKPNYRTALKGVVQDRSVSGATIFLEPQEVVELNNQLRLLQRSEEEEIRRVLAALTASLRSKAEAVLSTMLLAAELDCRCAAARLADTLHCTPVSLKDTGPLVLREARHPLLLEQTETAGTNQTIPIDLRLGDSFDALLITGPNTGGKTVALKTAGLLSLMAQAGLHLPTSPDSEVPFFSGVLADIGDEQSIEQSLSTFSSHIGQIRRILDAARPHTLVLLDELGAGTDPIEGACLGIAILEALLERGAMVVATTHLDAIKAYAYSHPRIENGCVEFDLDTLRPLYKLLIGLSGRSHGLAIASRIGLPSSVIQRAEGLLGEGGDPLRLLLDHLEGEQRRLAVEREALTREAAETAKARGEAEVRLDAARAEAEQICRRAFQQAEEAVTDARSEIDRLLLEFRSSQSRGQSAQEVRRQLIDLERQTQVALSDVTDSDRVASSIGTASVREGQEVFIKGLGQRGIVTGKPSSAGIVEIRLPLGKVRVPLEAVISQGDSGQGETSRPIRLSRIKDEVRGELNLIGCDATEAARRLDQYVGDAFLVGLPTVRIIHGKGSGILRKTVTEFLQDHPLVESFRVADYQEGGIGATIVELCPRTFSILTDGAA
ncbi:endonuclease MutS2 [Candidatus Methylomirabilis sp.]|uniref:endonuclease MutS2 n=1 Tax=Candidatus Methylomirabilis sp. TaxID=2032687 RepID=UPI002A65425A|nr:endonuclease MutS2 [Candidatus Methylomirabilis sp.]